MFDFSAFDLIQNRQIHQNQAEISQAKHRAGNARIDVEALEKDHERLKLLTLSLWELLKRHTGLTDSELQRMIEQVDRSDGKRDGRVETEPAMRTFHACNHRIPTSAIRCAYCGLAHTPSGIY